MDVTQTATALPHTLPDCANGRIALFAIRRMGGHGLDDARAAEMMLHAFGRSFRRPLVLTRVMLTDLAASAATFIAIAPCCCPRATHSEIGLLRVLQHAERSAMKAHLLLADLLGNRAVDGALASVTAVAAAYADLGRPIGRVD